MALQRSLLSYQMTESNAVTLLFYVNESGDRNTRKTHSKTSTSKTLATLLKQITKFWIFLPLFSRDSILLWIPRWPQMYHSPWDSQVLRLQVSATTPNPLNFWFCSQHNGFNHSSFSYLICIINISLLLSFLRFRQPGKYRPIFTLDIYTVLTVSSCHQ